MKLALRCVLLAIAASTAVTDSRIAGRGHDLKAGWRPPLSFESLPSTPGLPDVFVASNGERVTTREQWARRREEIKALLQYYQYGRIPPRPDKVTARLMERRPHRSGLGTEEWIRLIIGSKRRLEMRAVIYVPRDAGPRPVVIREEGSLGRTEQIPMFLEKGYMFVEYARHDLDPDKSGVVGPAQKAYPDHDWATLAVWAWGGMRVVDYLESRDDVDLERIAITGHSRGGKMALLAGALDERFTLVVPNGSGAGGAGSYRLLGPGAESLGMNDKPHWYQERIRWFVAREDRLPFDQHFLKALVAPRALLCTESIDDEFANPEGTQATSMAAQEVFEFLAAGSRNGLHYRRGRHESNTEDWGALLTFAEWQFFGRAPKDPSRFWRTPFPLPSSLVPAGKEPMIASENVEHASPKDSVLSFASVGYPGNASDQDYFGRGAYGQVAYSFDISRRQVTNAQYACFLNAVAEEDPNELYNPHMSGEDGGIVRRGSSGRYEYMVKRAKSANPVSHVSFLDALRFCNWLHNGRPVGKQDSSSTEDGAYTIEGPVVGPRKAGAKYSLPSENEWYKAAYYDPTADEGPRYVLFDRRPNGELSVVRHSNNQESALGMSDVNNKVWEWNESKASDLFRGLRSGAWFLGNNRQAAGRFFSNPELEHSKVGFRVVRHGPPSTGDLPKVSVSNIRRAIHNGEHNAFTDLVRYQGRYYLTFRSCPDGHSVHPTASIIVLSSADAEQWEQVHRFRVPKRDTRDPHFLVFRGKLFVYTGTWYSGERSLPSRQWDLNLHLGYAVWSRDGQEWNGPTLLEGTFGHYIWRANTFGGKAYLCGRRKIGFAVGPKGEGNEVESLMLESDDGLVWRKRAVFQSVRGDETAFQFEPDGRVVAIGRRGRGTAQHCVSRPPYAQWVRRDLDRYIGGPLLARWGNRYVVGGRRFTESRGPKTSLCWFVRGELHEFAELPSGGDNSYPGFVELSSRRALMSWYSSHEKDANGRMITAIYLADLELME